MSTFARKRRSRSDVKRAGDKERNEAFWDAFTGNEGAPRRSYQESVFNKIVIPILEVITVFNASGTVVDSQCFI